MNLAGTETYFSDGGRGTDAFRWRPSWGEAASLVLAALDLLVRFARAPGATAEPFPVDPGLWNPNLPFISPTRISLGVAALASGFVSPRGFYLWGSRWPPTPPSRMGCPPTRWRGTVRSWLAERESLWSSP